MNNTRKETEIQRLLADAEYCEEQAVWCRHFVSNSWSDESKDFWENYAKTYDKMSKKRRAEARRLERST